MLAMPVQFQQLHPDECTWADLGTILGLFIVVLIFLKDLFHIFCAIPFLVELNGMIITTSSKFEAIVNQLTYCSLA